MTRGNVLSVAHRVRVSMSRRRCASTRTTTALLVAREEAR